jgi:hypothetical protein
MRRNPFVSFIGLRKTPAIVAAVDGPLESGTMTRFARELADRSATGL